MIFSEFFFQYCKTNQIDLNRSNRFGLTPFQYYELQKFKKQEDWNQIDRFLLNLNDKNPSTAFHAIFLISQEVEETTIRTILESFLNQPKLPVLEWSELYLWKTIFDLKENKNLKDLLLNRFPEPPAGIWDFLTQDESLPNDPVLSTVWLRSIQKGKSVQLQYDWQTLNVHGEVNSALKECKLDLLEELASQPSLWQLTNPEGFSEHFYYTNCEDEKEEQKLYQLLQSVQANPGKGDWIPYSPLCLEIPNKDQSKDPKIRERSLRRISILLKMGASPNCYSNWGENGFKTALDATRKYELKHLEELLLSFGAEDQRKAPLQKAILAKNKTEIQKLLDQGAVIDVEELKLAKGDSKILSYLLEEYNSLRKSPLLREIKIERYLNKPVKVTYDLSFFEILLKKGFSLKVRSLDEHHIEEESAMDGYTYRTSCAVAKIMNSDSKNLISLLRSQNFSNYSCRGFYFTWFFEEKMREKIKKLKLDSVFPELHEESYLYEHE